MKKLLAIMALLLISSGAMAQTRPPQSQPQPQPKYQYFQEMQEKEVINNINEINISLQRYSKIQLGGEIAMIAGSTVTILSSMSFANNPNDNGMAKFGMIIGGVTALGGYIAKIHSLSYLKKIKIQGSSIVYKF